MKIFFWTLKKSFFLLTVSVFFLAFAISYSIRSTLIHFFNVDYRIVERNVFQEFQKEKLKNSSLIPETIDNLVEGNLIRGIAVSLSPEIVEDTPKLETDPKVTSMLITGTVSGRQSFARVTIKEKDKEEAEEYKVGQKLGIYKILRINPSSITIGGDNFSFNVEIGETIESAIQKRQPQEEIQSASSESFATEHRPVNISRTDFEKIVRDPTAIYKNARFAPNLVQGKIDGMIIYEVSPSHLFSQLGAKNGDIIKRVNGMPLGETEKMLEIWNSIKASTKINVDVDRKGQIHSYTFLVRQ